MQKRLDVLVLERHISTNDGLFLPSFGAVGVGDEAVNAAGRLVEGRLGDDLKRIGGI